MRTLEDFGIDPSDESPEDCNICIQAHYRMEFINTVIDKIGMKNCMLLHLNNNKDEIDFYRTFLLHHFPEYITEFEKLLTLL